MFKKSLLLASDRRSHCKCCKMFTFPHPTTWRPEQLAYTHVDKTSKWRHCQPINTCCIFELLALTLGFQ